MRETLSMDVIKNSDCTYVDLFYLYYGKQPE